MSSKSNFFKKGLCVVGSSVATAGSLFSATGVEAAGNAMLEKQLKEVLSKNLWYIILKFFNFGGVLQEKIEKIEKEQSLGLMKKKIDELLQKKFKEVKYFSKKDFTLINVFGGFSEEKIKKIDWIRDRIKGILEIDKKRVYAYCYDDKAKVHTLLKLKEDFSEGGEICSYSEQSMDLKSVKEFYVKLVDLCYTLDYNKEICTKFYNFLDEESKKKEKGLFERSLYRKVERRTTDDEERMIFDFNFDCFIGKNKLSYVWLEKEGQKITDICVVYNFGPKGSSGRYRAGEEGLWLSEGEMAMYLEDIMEQAKKYKQGKNTGWVNQFFNSIFNNSNGL